MSKNMILDSLIPFKNQETSFFDSVDVRDTNKKYIVICCVDHEIKRIGSVYYDHRDATLAMKKSFIEALIDNDYDLEDNDDGFFSKEDCFTISDYDFAFDEDSAWLSDSSESFNYDWKIIEIEV